MRIIIRAVHIGLHSYCINCWQYNLSWVGALKISGVSPWVFKQEKGDLILKNARLTVPLIVLLLCLSTQASAALVAGTYDLTNWNGSWTEYFGSGGEGTAGSFLMANANTGNRWSFSATSTGIAQPGSYAGGYNYATSYTVFSASIAPNPSAWGDYIFLSNATATNYSLASATGLQFLFTASGTTSSGIPILFEALFNSSAPGSTYSSSTDFHSGSGFERLTLTVVPIPAAAWMLGAGIIGLIAIRRKNRN
jgi:hypothetical protein